MDASVKSLLHLSLLLAALLSLCPYPSSAQSWPVPTDGGNVIQSGLPTLRTFYIDAAKGNDSSIGSEASPFRTLQKAVSQSRYGDVLHLNPGVYQLHQMLMIPAGVRIYGRDPETTVIQAADDFSGWSDLVATNSCGDWRGPCSDKNSNEIHGVTLDGRKLVKVGLRAWYGQKHVYTNLVVKNFQEYGVLLRGTEKELSHSKFYNNAKLIRHGGEWTSNVQYDHLTKSFIHDNYVEEDSGGGIDGAPGSLRKQLRIYRNKVVLKGNSTHPRNGCTSLTLWDMQHDNRVYDNEVNAWVSVVQQWGEAVPDTGNIFFYNNKIIATPGVTDVSSAIEVAIRGGHFFNNFISGFRHYGFWIEGYSTSAFTRNIYVYNNVLQNPEGERYGRLMQVGGAGTNTIQNIHAMNNVVSNADIGFVFGNNALSSRREIPDPKLEGLVFGGNTVINANSGYLIKDPVSEFLQYYTGGNEFSNVKQIQAQLQANRLVKEHTASSIAAVDTVRMLEVALMDLHKRGVVTDRKSLINHLPDVLYFRSICRPGEVGTGLGCELPNRQNRSTFWRGELLNGSVLAIDASHLLDGLISMVVYEPQEPSRLGTIWFVFNQTATSKSLSYYDSSSSHDVAPGALAPADLGSNEKLSSYMLLNYTVVPTPRPAPRPSATALPTSTPTTPPAATSTPLPHGTPPRTLTPRPAVTAKATKTPKETSTPALTVSATPSKTPSSRPTAMNPNREARTLVILMRSALIRTSAIMRKVYRTREDEAQLARLKQPLLWALNETITISLKLQRLAPRHIVLESASPQLLRKVKRIAQKGWVSARHGRWRGLRLVVTELRRLEYRLRRLSTNSL